MKTKITCTNRLTQSKNIFLFSSLLALTSCGGGGEKQTEETSSNLNEVDITNQVINTPEIERLHYFKEIKADKARKDFNVTGNGVHITIMGEITDASHPDILNRVTKQFNTLSTKGVVNPGSGNQPYQFDLYGSGHGHGTHVAGTIAAECDDIGIEGVACGSTLDVYDIGTYGNERIEPQGWGDVDYYEIFIDAFSAALNDVTQRNSSRIITGSFNIEAPAIQYQTGGSLEGESITNIIQRVEQDVKSIADLKDKDLINFQDEADIAYLQQMSDDNTSEDFLTVGALLPKSSQWAALEDAIKAYQDNDGVYIITESNINFDDRTSVMNAMPSLSSKVDPDLWISAVMVQPKKYVEGETPDTSKEYITPLNSCGEMASAYCILTPSYNVLSSMTRKVAERTSPFYLIDQRGYQLFSGHSMGAPMIAAALALMEEYNQQKNLGLTMKDLVRILKANANRSFEGYDVALHGQGMLDVSAALGAMK